MTQDTLDTVVSEDIRIRTGVRVGILSDLEPREINGDEILVGFLNRVVKGETVIEPISVRGDALLALRDVLVEGASVRLWGEVHADYFKVRGPDVTRRTLIRELKKIQDEASARSTPAAKTLKRQKSIRELRRGAIIARKRREAQAAAAAA